MPYTPVMVEILRDFGWSYRIRIKASFGIYSSDKKLLCKVGQVALKPGQAKYYQNVRLTARHFGLVHVALARPEGVTELWAVVSDEPTGEQTCIEYGWRFQIEKCFWTTKVGRSIWRILGCRCHSPDPIPRKRCRKTCSTISSAFDARATSWMT
jgi:hypothetical protein